MIPDDPCDTEGSGQDQQGQQYQASPGHGGAWKSTMDFARSGLKYFSKIRSTVPSARISFTSARHLSCSTGESAVFDMIRPWGMAGSLNSMMVVTSRIFFSSSAG